MQEEVENRTVNLMISTSKLTRRTLVAAFRKYAQYRVRVKAGKAAEGDHGKMTVEKLIRKDQGAQQIDIAKSGIKDFERVLDKYGVDYAIRKDVSQVSAPVIKCKKTPRKKCKFVAERRKKR